MKINRILAGIFLAALILLPAKSASQKKEKINHREQKVPILYYHHVSRKFKQYSISPASFRKHLIKLYNNNFVTIKVKDLLENNLPKDKKAVVISFDDGWQDQFNYINGKIDPNCAVGILNNFYSEHHDFGKHAIFFVSFDKIPFGQWGYVKNKLETLLANDMEIGNHTYSHANLRNASKEKIDRELGKAMQKFEQFLGENAKKINAVALPYGEIPRNRKAFDELKNFRLNGIEYESKAVFTTEHNFYSKNTNNYRIPRIGGTNNNIDEIIKDFKY